MVKYLWPVRFKWGGEGGGVGGVMYVLVFPIHL